MFGRRYAPERYILSMSTPISLLEGLPAADPRGRYRSYWKSGAVARFSFRGVVQTLEGVVR